MCFTLDIAMDVAFLISWGAWNADDFVGNLGISGEFLFSTGLVELLPVSNYESLTFSLTQKPATSILRSPRESYDSGSTCKISESVKRTWAFLIFFALEMWLTWYQFVDHVYYSESNLAKGMSLINDSLNTKVSPFSIHPSLLHIDSWARNPHHQSNTLINPSPKIYLRLIYPRTGYAKTASTRYDATSSYRITLDPLELP